MKKFIIVSLVFALFGASVAYGAVKVQELKWYDYVVSVSTPNNGNIFINKFSDEGNTCYIMHSDSTKWGGINYGISCVKK
jgi:hypothetical protein